MSFEGAGVTTAGGGGEWARRPWGLVSVTAEQKWPGPFS